MLGKRQETLGEVTKPSFLNPLVRWELMEIQILVPLVTNDLTDIVKSNFVLNDAFIAKMNTTKGFHAIEFFLFGEKGIKKVSNFSARELTLLSLLTKDLKQESIKLKDVWTKGKNSFADSFIKADSGSDLYPKASDVLAEITGVMVGICTELPDDKMEEPLKRQDNNYAESPFIDYKIEKPKRSHFITWVRGGEIKRFV